MLRLAFSTNAYLRFSFEETARRIAEIGYEGLELMADVPHAWPAGLLPETKRGIREAMTKNGLTFSNVNAFMMNAVADSRQPYWYPSFIDPEPNYRQVGSTTRNALSLCAGPAPISPRSLAVRSPTARPGSRRSTCSSRF